ncbi:MAG TPA: indole-3-glycerol phosphate synthase TrpC [Chitinophagaceae bacterium]|nr:indole-3-glycerol phosphate synthase TrpC [Chitinophagaceae bacterium]
MNILEQIILSKRVEVEKRKAERPLHLLERSSFFSRETLSLKQSILDPQKTGIIAEFKRRSPSKGVINDQADVSEVTTMYTSGGASGLSVLTDFEFFGGTEADLQQARLNRIPILRKDFIVDEYQVVEARAMGADVILLIASCLSPSEVLKLASFANNLQLEVLLELHEEEEIEHINEYTALVGINNRSLKTFSVDMEKSISMSEKIGKAAVRVAESGISEPEDIIRFRQYGFDGFLIGERFMREKDPGPAFNEFVDKLKSLA